MNIDTVLPALIWKRAVHVLLPFTNTDIEVRFFSFSIKNKYQNTLNANPELRLKELLLKFNFKILRTIKLTPKI